MVVGNFAQGTQLAVIGAGPGGYVAAIRAAQLGIEVTLVERQLLGGVCLNWGCIPSKALIQAAWLKGSIQTASEMGIIVDRVSVDMQRLIGWKNSIVEKLRRGVGTLLAQHKVQVVEGSARLTGDRAFSVDTSEGLRRFEFESCILAVGSSAVELPGLPRDGQVVIDSTDALDLASVPERMVVIGAGSVGLELSMAYAGLGASVTILESADRLLPAVDSQIVPVLRRSLQAHGIELVLAAKLLGVARREGGAEVTWSTAQGDRTQWADRVLVAVGRRPNTAGMGLEKARIKLDPKGFIDVNNRMETSVSGIYAIGDIVRGPMLAHRASYQGKVAAEAVAGLPAGYDGAEVPAVIFTDPEIACVGLTEDMAREQGRPVQIGVFPFRALGRAITMDDQPPGFSKIVSDAATGVVLGVHIVGHHASDLISEGCLAVASASHVDDLALTMHPHPTLAEGIEEAAEQVGRRAIHIFTPPA